MLLLPQGLLKDSEFKGCRASITAILSFAACMVPASIFHWSRFGTASLKAAELDRSTHW